MYIHIQWRPFIARFIIANILYSSILISLHNMLPFKLIKDTPYLALSGELWSVFNEYFNINWSCYRGFLLYTYVESSVITPILTTETFNNAGVIMLSWNMWGCVYSVYPFFNDDCANMCTYFIRSRNNGMRCMSLYIFTVWNDTRYLYGIFRWYELRKYHCSPLSTNVCQRRRRWR